MSVSCSSWEHKFGSQHLMGQLPVACLELQISTSFSEMGFLTEPRAHGDPIPLDTVGTACMCNNPNTGTHM